MDHQGNGNQHNFNMFCALILFWLLLFIGSVLSDISPSCGISDEPQFCWRGFIIYFQVICDRTLEQSHTNTKAAHDCWQQSHAAFVFVCDCSEHHMVDHNCRYVSYFKLLIILVALTPLAPSSVLPVYCIVLPSSMFYGQ